MGINVDCTNTIPDAKKMLTAKHYDAICLDIAMDGEEAIDLFKRNRSKTVLVTAWNPAKALERELQTEILMKPFDIEILEKKILTIIESNNMKRTTRLN